jgi:DNA-binding IclR family transcriptional regulator
MFGFSVRVGHRRPITLSTSGLILFGCSSDAFRKSWSTSLRRTAPRGFDFEKFGRDAAMAKRRGYAIVDSTAVSAVTDVAAPISDGSGPTPVAVLVVPFLMRVEESIEIAQAASAVVRAAETISDRLRHG